MNRDLPHDVFAFFAYARAGLRTAAGFTRDTQGANLPKGYGLWRPTDKRTRWPIDMNKVLANVNRYGYHVEQRVVRDKQSFSNPPR